MKVSHSSRIYETNKIGINKILNWSTHISKFSIQRRVLEGVFQETVQPLLKEDNHYGTAVHIRKMHVLVSSRIINTACCTTIAEPHL